tara:strand:- start:5022 stop:5306 length:285 start_codon:yes stop_codon:yes gene_type:complete
MSNGKKPKKKKKYVSAAKGYNSDEGYFQSLLKAVQENPNAERPFSKDKIEKHQRDLNQSAKQKQIIDYRNKSLTLTEMKKGGKIKDFRGNKQHD